MRLRKQQREDKETHLYFIDLKTVFDNINREDIWKVLSDRGTSVTLVKMIQIFV